MPLQAMTPQAHGLRTDAKRSPAGSAHPRLAVSTPGDPLEREADRMAGAAVSASSVPAPPSSAPRALRRCACGGGCPSCRKEGEEELRRAEGGGGGGPGFAPPIVHDVLASPGRVLPGDTRGFMEARFGADFSAVRVHDDARAAESARAVRAHAYAVGSDVVFGAGRFAPGTAAGDRLLAHELAHTLQQGAPALRRQPAGDLFGGAGSTSLRDPRSLSTSVDVSNASMADIRAEIAAIRRWLAANPAASGFPADHLRKELARLDLLVPAHAAVWDAFATKFNQRFADVLPGFTPSGAPQTSAELHVLFTETQRLKLEDFISTKRIPERLFSGTDRGGATAQQRLLLSAHILAYGTYRPGSFEQRVHAQFCFHWVQVVHHYAGATPPGSGFSRGVMGSFDPLGAAVLTTGTSVDVWRQAYVKKPNLPSTEVPGGTGPLHEGTPHAVAAARAEAADPAKGARFHRQPSLPLARFDEIQAGDWLWYYNANASEGGAHSVIFSHWEGGNVTRDDGSTYRVAIVWSQPTSPRGGMRHRARLGDRFVPNQANHMDPLVVPITHVSRVTPGTAPATTVAGMLPISSGKAATALAAENARHIRDQEKKLKVTVDEAKLREWLRHRNAVLLAGLAAHLEARQTALLAEANQIPELEARTRLFQRLRALSANAELLDRNLAATYARLDPAHAAARAKADAALAAAIADVGAADAELANVARDIEAGSKRRTELDVQPAIDDLNAKATALRRQREKMKAGPDRDEVDARRQHLLDQAAALAIVRKGNAPELAKVKTEISRLGTRRRELDSRRAKLVKARDAAASPTLPYGMVHPTPLTKEETRGVTGKLAHVSADVDWAAVSVPNPPAPASSPKKKP